MLKNGQSSINKFKRKEAKVINEGFNYSIYYPLI